jgi:hypothetical protein
MNYTSCITKDFEVIDYSNNFETSSSGESTHVFLWNSIEVMVQLAIQSTDMHISAP